jgi:hypothetical protein
MKRPSFNGAAALQFVVNGKAGSSDADAMRDAIESGLREAVVPASYASPRRVNSPGLLEKARRRPWLTARRSSR